VEDRVDGLLGHDLGGVLVDEVVTTLDGVEGVPLPVVLFHVGQRGAHAALGRAGVATGRVQLGQHSRSDTGARLDGGAHARAAGTDDDDVVAMFPNRTGCDGAAVAFAGLTHARWPVPN